MVNKSKLEPELCGRPLVCVHNLCRQSLFNQFFPFATQYVTPKSRQISSMKHQACCLDPDTAGTPLGKRKQFSLPSPFSSLC